ncbi:MAG TPA: hypothetical protein VIF62_31940 [Labilithrix sp.]
MGSIKIKRLWTANPADIDTPQNVFYWDDAFGIVVEVEYKDIAEWDMELQIQLVNPRQDAFGGTWFREDGMISPTIDWLFNVGQPDAETIQYRLFWPAYSDIFAGIGGGSLAGIFAVQSYIRVADPTAFEDWFDMTAPFAAKYHLRSGTRPSSSAAGGSGGGGGARGSR